MAEVAPHTLGRCQFLGRRTPRAVVPDIEAFLQKTLTDLKRYLGRRFQPSRGRADIQGKIC